MDEITFDWLQQINQEAWRRRIWQLRRELSQEQSSSTTPASTTASSITTSNPNRSTSPD